MAITPHSMGVQNNLSDRKLYLRFPKRIPSEDEIKRLSSHIDSVIKPRQKSSRFCHIVLESPDVLDQVLKELDGMPFGERGKLKVEKLRYSNVEVKTEKENNLTPNKPNKVQKINKDGEVDQRRVFFRKIPASTTDEDLKKLPGCVWVKLYTFKSSKKKASALCKFASNKLAKEIVDNPEKYLINGEVPVVEFAINQGIRGGKKNKKVVNADKKNNQKVAKNNGEKFDKKKGKKFNMRLVKDSTETTEEERNIKEHSDDDSADKLDSDNSDQKHEVNIFDKMEEEEDSESEDEDMSD